MIQPAQRMTPIRAYFFAELAKRIAALRAQGMEVIRLDMGAPDLPPPDFVIEALVKAAQRPDTHSYTPYGGTPEFKEAVAAFYKQRFDVDLDPQTEVLALIGSKEGLFHLSQAFLNPGDVALVPDPGYPTYKAGALLAGAEVHFLPLTAEHNFFPNLEAIPAEVLQRARILWLNYPNNPTGAVASLDDLARAVDFARRHNLILAHDAPYTEVAYDGYRAPSVLQVPGAKEVAVEFHSFSKSYNMAGWRLGMLVGNAEVVRYVHTYKSQVDTSVFLPILQAGIVALTDPRSAAWIAERNAIYRERRDIILEGLAQTRLHAEAPKAAMYIWARLPAEEPDSRAYCDRLLREAGVSVTPGVVFGPHGEGYVRISLGTATDQVVRAMERWVAWEQQQKSQ